MAFPRQSSFMPTIKCSTCAADVEISMMGEHICEEPQQLQQPLPPIADFDDRDMPYGKQAALPSSKYGRTPANLDTSAANRPYVRPGQLTPQSNSSDSRSISPRTPGGRYAGGRQDDYFTPSIASDYGGQRSPAPPTARKAGGYGGLGAQPSYDDEMDQYSRSPQYSQSPNMDQYSQSPKMANFMDRMNNIAPGPFETRRNQNSQPERNNSYSSRNEEYPSRNNSTADRYGSRNNSTTDDRFKSRNNSSDGRYGNENSVRGMDRPGTSGSGGGNSMAPPRVPRKNGYGGFGPPEDRQQDIRQEDFEPQPFERAGTFPKQSAPNDAPNRNPSAPGRRPDHKRHPSRGPDTTRRLPPRTSITRVSATPSVNLADEFGIGNPYYNPSESLSSGMSTYSASSRPSNMSSNMSSNMTSPSSLDSFEQQPPAPPAKPGADLFDDLMSDLQTSMNENQPSSQKQRQQQSSDDPYASSRKDDGRDRRDDYGISPPKKDYNRAPSRNDYDTGRYSPPDDYPRAPSRGNDFTRAPTYGSDYARAPSRGNDSDMDMSLKPQPDMWGRKGGAPLPSPTLDPRDNGRFSPLPSPKFNSPPRDPSRADSRRGRNRDMSEPDGPRDRHASEPRDRANDPALQDFRSKPAGSQPPPSNRQREPSTTHRADPAVQPGRGNCRACGLVIRGKSIASADGRLTGRYHKACFVCTTCKEPFTSTTFYVFGDRSYCEKHYHKVNGSECGTCKRGIEGQYMADEEGTKYHPGCFRCADCGDELRDGYFEVNGVSYCERDAWRRVQQPWNVPQQQQQQQQQQSRHGRKGSVGLGGLGKGPRAGKAGVGIPPMKGLGLPGGRPKMNKRMTRLGMM